MCVCVCLCVCICKYETRENCTHAEHTVHVRFDTGECEKRFAASKRDERDGDNEDTRCFAAEETVGRDRKERTRRVKRIIYYFFFKKLQKFAH